MQIKPKQMSVREVSITYRIPEWTLRKYLFKGLIPYRKVRRKIYIPIDKFEAWLETFDIEPKVPKEEELQ